MDKTAATALGDYLEQHISFTDDLGVTGCDGTLKYTNEWMKANRHPSSWPAFIEFISANGGYCDCEVILNVILKVLGDEPTRHAR